MKRARERERVKVVVGKLPSLFPNRLGLLDILSGIQISQSFNINKYRLVF